ncbi:hypothetical protein CVT25_005177 [Psilocybe cyanescens]|uniref:Uncharacterized protein n=1 Tax=Psilocybe cyanescens TaxID=93625 RepID=A0A409XBR2_PSICY|nr:hypothetical protein CVT25_005177 [Psilocybe cyanescens]
MPLCTEIETLNLQTTSAKIYPSPQHTKMHLLCSIKVACSSPSPVMLIHPKLHIALNPPDRVQQTTVAR